MTIFLHIEYTSACASFLGMKEIVSKVLFSKGWGGKTEKVAFLYLHLSGNIKVNAAEQFWFNFFCYLAVFPQLQTEQRGYLGNEETVLQNGFIDLKASRADFHQPAWFNQDTISWPSFSWREQLKPQTLCIPTALHWRCCWFPWGEGEQSQPLPSAHWQSLSAAEASSPGILLMWTHTHVKY